MEQLPLTLEPRLDERTLVFTETPFGIGGEAAVRAAMTWLNSRPG